LYGSFTGSASQSEEGEGFLGDELDWEGDVSLGGSYEMDGDAGVEFLYDICDCYYDESDSPTATIPSAPTISVIGLYLGIPSAVAIQFGFSASVLDTVSLQQNGGAPTYISVSGSPAVNVNLDQSALPVGMMTYSVVGYMYGQEVPGANYSVTRTDGNSPNTGFTYALTGGDGLGLSLQEFDYDAQELWSTFNYESYGDSGWDLARGGNGNVSTDSCVGTSPESCPDEAYMAASNVSGTNYVTGYSAISMSNLSGSSLPPQSRSYQSLENDWSLWVNSGGGGEICIYVAAINPDSTVVPANKCLSLSLP
jgi:hypothetical protein